MPNRDDETGEYTGRYPNSEFLDAIQKENGLVGTGEIAKIVGCAHDTAYKRLQKLEEEGVVGSQKVGNTLVWFVID